MSTAGPTERTLKALRKIGYICQVVERWNAFARKRVDLFNFIDIIAIKDDKIVGIQCTSYANHASRKKKILDNEIAPTWIEAGGEIQVWSWKKRIVKKRPKWEPRVEIITEQMFKKKCPF